MSRMKMWAVAPEAYRAVLGLETYVRENLDHTVLELVKLRASMLNGCAFCVDMHSRDALAAGESSRRLFAVAAWREAPFFDESPRSRCEHRRGGAGGGSPASLPASTAAGPVSRRHRSS